MYPTDAYVDPFLDHIVGGLALAYFVQRQKLLVKKEQLDPKSSEEPADVKLTEEDWDKAVETMMVLYDRIVGNRNKATHVKIQDIWMFFESASAKIVEMMQEEPDPL